MKFLVPNCSCLQNPVHGPLSSTEFVEPPPPEKKFPGTPLITSNNGCYRNKMEECGLDSSRSG